MYFGNSREYIEEKLIEKKGKEIELSKEQKAIINYQMEKSLCRILIDNPNFKCHGSGFFCYLPFCPYNFKVLITNNHLLGEKDLIPGKEIVIKINGDKISKTIKIIESRKIYTNYVFDVTIVEILPCDNIDESCFMKIDNNIFSESINYEYKKKNIYLIHYPKGNIAKYSLGIIQDISVDNKYNIEHTCSTEHGSSGCPILLLHNYKIIEVHKGATNDFNFNLGTLLKGPIIEFTNKYLDYSGIIKRGKKVQDQLEIIKTKINCPVVGVSFNYKTQEDFGYSSGFLCKILIKNKLLPVLITGFKCYLEDIITLNINLDNDKYKYNINIHDYSRIKYKDLYNGLAIIEIKPKDNLDISTLEVVSDKNYLFNQELNFLINKKIYIIMYLKEGEKISKSYGSIKAIDHKDIIYDCKTDFGSQGAPIFDKETNKILGVHFGYNREKEYYTKFGYKSGRLLSNLLEDFYNNVNL